MNSDIQIVTELPADLRVGLTADYPDLDEILDKRRKLLKKVEGFEPVESVDDTPRMDDAKRLRLDLVKCRTAMDRIRKDAGEASRKRTNSINDLFRGLINENESAEDFLKENEEFAIRYEQSRKAELRQERLAGWRQELMPEDLLVGIDLGELTEAQFQVLVDGAAKVKIDREVLARVAKEAEEKDRLERQRLQEENNRLRREQEESQRLERERVAAEQKKAEDEKKAAAKAKRAPDKTKLMAYCNLLGQMASEHCPKVKEESELVLDTFKGKLDRLLGEFEKQIQAL